MKQLLNRHLNLNTLLITICGVLLAFGLQKADASYRLLISLETKESMTAGRVEDLSKAVSEVRNGLASERNRLTDHMKQSKP